jgi:hypothetical protein
MKRRIISNSLLVSIKVTLRKVTWLNQTWLDTRSSILGRSVIHSYSCCSLWSTGHPWNASFYFRFIILRQSVELLGPGINPSKGRYLYRTTQTQNTRIQTSSGFEPTTLVLAGEDSRQECTVYLFFDETKVDSAATIIHDCLVAKQTNWNTAMQLSVKSNLLKWEEKRRVQNRRKIW